MFDLEKVVMLFGVLLIALVIVELVYALKMKAEVFEFADSITSLSLLSILYATSYFTVTPVASLASAIWLKYSLFTIQEGILPFIVCFLFCDLAFYFFHRVSHRVNLFWAAHLVHHSSNHYNLLISLRGGIFQRSISMFFYFPLVFLGFSPNTVFAVAALNLLVNAMTHTLLLPRFPRWVSKIFVTPDFHQVHHANNRLYWDKNFGGTFSIWDHLFGTSMEKTENLQFGLSPQISSTNPVEINLLGYKKIIQKYKDSNRSFLALCQAVWLYPSYSSARFVLANNLDNNPSENSSNGYNKNEKVVILGQVLLTLALSIPIIRPRSDLNIFLMILDVVIVVLGALITNLLLLKDHNLKKWYSVWMLLCLVFVIFFFARQNFH